MKKIFTLTLVLLAMAFAGNAQALLSENFDNGTIPTGWVTVDADGDTYTWEGSANPASYFQAGTDLSGSGHNLSNGFLVSGSYSNVYGVLTPDNWLITPAINLTANSNLTFWVCAQDASYPNEHYGVYISTTAGTTPADFTLLSEETIDENGGSRQGEWKQKTVNLASYTGQTVRIAFRHFNCSDEFLLDLDDVEIVAQPTTPTIFALPTTIDFGTIVLGGSTDATVNVTSYNLSAGVTVTTTAPFSVSADGTTFATTATLANTGGTLYVRYNPAVAGTDNGTVTLSSTGAPDVTITVTGSSVDCSNITIPFTEGFESSIDCWTMVSMDPVNDNRFGVYADANAYDGSNDFRFSSFSTATDYNQYLISPELTLTGTDSYVLTFFYKGYNSSENFRVLYSTTNSNISSFTQLADYTNVATSWTQVSLELPAGTKYFAINYYGNYQYYLYIDNISVANATPSIALNLDAIDFGTEPIGSISDVEEVNLTAVSITTPITLSVAAPFEVSADSINFAATATIPASSNIVANHTFYVRFAPTAVGTFTQNVTVTNGTLSETVALTGSAVDCSGGIASLPFTYDFNDAIVPPLCWTVASDPTAFYAASTGVEGDYAAGIEDVDALITPEIHTTDAILVSFNYINYFGTGATEPTYFQVGYSTTDNNPSSFTWQGSNLCAVDEFATFTTIVPAGTKYVAIGVSEIGEGLYYGAFEMADVFFIDNLSLTALTQPMIIVSPESISFGSIMYGTTSTVQTANVVGALLTNDIAVTAPANFEVSTNGTTFSSTATIPAAGGNLYVRYNPSAAGNHNGTITLTSGTASETITVSGNAIDCSTPFAIPFTEDFEAELSGCWTILDEDGDGYSWMNYGMAPYEGDGCISSASYINDIGALTPDNWLISPALAIPSQGAKLSFFVNAQDASYAYEHYGVYVSTSGVAPSNFMLLYEEDLDEDGGDRAPGAWKEKLVNLPYGGQNIHIAIRHFNCTDMFWMNVDNISVTPGTGIENHGLSTKVYPNPANNVLNINATANINRVEIFNMMGQMVGSYTANDVNTQINTTSFANGVYTVKIETENGTSTKKFTVAR